VSALRSVLVGEASTILIDANNMLLSQSHHAQPATQSVNVAAACT